MSATASPERTDNGTGNRDPDLIHIALKGRMNALCGVPMNGEKASRVALERDPCIVCYEIDRAQRIRAGIV